MSIKGDRIFFWLLLLISSLFVFVVFLLGFSLFYDSIPILRKEGINFILGTTWDPVHETFGILPMIFGSFVTSLIALFVAVSIGLFAAYFIAELVPSRIKPIISSLVELLAAIPSVVYGLWGLFILAPFLRDNVYKPLQSTFGFLPIFQGAVTGLGILTAGLVLAIMILPTFIAIVKSAMELLPVYIKEAAISLGALRYEVASIIFKHIRLAIIAALLLAFARAFGEAMAVAMVIGGKLALPNNIFDLGYTMPSLIVNEFVEAVTDVHYQALIATGFILFLIALINIVIARIIIARLSKFLEGATI